MSDWKNRLVNRLEPVLREADPRANISSYHDMPYAIFQYAPEDEFDLRSELTLLKTRLEQIGKRVTVISLAQCLNEALKRERDVYKRQGCTCSTSATIASFFPVVIKVHRARHLACASPGASSNCLIRSSSTSAHCLALRPPYSSTMWSPATFMALIKASSSVLMPCQKNRLVMASRGNSAIPFRSANA